MSEATSREHESVGLDPTFEKLGPLPTAPPPPAAFLQAVGRRRRQRRLLQSAAALCLLAAVAIPVWLTLSQPSTQPALSGQIAGNTDAAHQQTTAVDTDGLIPTRATLLHLNPQLDERRLVLPASYSAGGREPELGLTTAWNDEAINRLLRN